MLSSRQAHRGLLEIRRSLQKGARHTPSVTRCQTHLCLVDILLQGYEIRQIDLKLSNCEIIASQPQYVTVNTKIVRLNLVTFQLLYRYRSRTNFFVQLYTYCVCERLCSSSLDIQFRIEYTCHVANFPILHIMIL